MSKGGRSPKKTGLHDINFVKYNITKQGQGFRKATFAQNSVRNCKHSQQSCEYISFDEQSQDCLSKGGQSPKKALRDINLVTQNISFNVFSINLNKGSLVLPIMSKGSIAQKV